MNGVKKKINHQAVFKQRTKNDDNAELSDALILSARKTGHLNLSAKGLLTVPNRVWSINGITEQELKELHYEFDYEHQEKRWWEQELLKILNLSSNSITEIDPQVGQLTELRTLYLHDNLLEDLPNEIGNLDKLRELTLSNNKLEKLMLQLFKLTELRILSLKNNALKEIDPAIGDLIMLTHLDLSCNNLHTLPLGMGYLVRLVSLDLSHNKLKELPSDLTNMRALQKFDASFNQLEELPPLGGLRKIEIAMLQTNKLTTFPDMCGCTLLKVLRLAHNDITEIDMSHLEGVGQLRELSLENNKIDIIPEEIMKLVYLETLDVSNNKIIIIPDCVGIMPNLKRLLIDGNSVKNVRQDIISCGTPRILKYIRQHAEFINLNTNVMANQWTISNPSTNFYPDKYTMRCTKLLSLSGKNFAELPTEVLEEARMADVTTVDLSRNKLCKLPDELSIIPLVADLKLTSNQLTTLPEWIGEKYKFLQVLDLSKNFLRSLPFSLGLLQYLREIDISFNRYTEIPESVYNVCSLEIFRVNDNSITCIDVPSLQKLTKLATLNLMNNNIAHVPPELGNLKNLRTLLLSGNSFKQPRQAILMKPTDEILAYLRNRIPHDHS